jgi:hypothetical protein
MKSTSRPALAGLLALSFAAFAGQALAEETITASSNLAVTTGSWIQAMAEEAGSSAVVFDNMTPFQTGVSGATVTATSSTPNTFMGAAYTLLPGTTSITGFDLYPANLAGTTFTGIKATVYVWGGVNTGTVSAASPAFSNLLGSFTVTATGSFPTGSFFNFESATPGVTPGITLTTPLALPSTTIGLTFNYQGTTDGVTYTNVNSLTSLITYGAAPTVGTQVGNGYYRNASSETNGNFVSGLRSLGFTNQSLGVRVYGEVSPVPEPATWLTMALGVGALLLRRNRRA